MKQFISLLFLLIAVPLLAFSQTKISHSVRFDFLAPRMDMDVNDLEKMRDFVTIPSNNELKLGYSLGYVGVLETNTMLKPSLAVSFDISNFGLQSHLDMRTYNTFIQLGSVYTTKSQGPELTLRSGLGASIRTFRGYVGEREYDPFNAIYELYVFDWASRVTYSAFFDLSIEVFKLNDTLPVLLTGGYAFPLNNIYNDRGFALKFHRTHLGIQITFD